MYANEKKKLQSAYLKYLTWQLDAKVKEVGEVKNIMKKMAQVCQWLHLTQQTVLQNKSLQQGDTMDLKKNDIIIW